MPLVSTRTRYALHGFAYIAAHAHEAQVPLADILRYLRDYSKSLTLSPGYIAKIFQQVSRAGLARTVTGPGGGYALARSADRISLLEVVEAMDGPLATDCCLLAVGSCDRQGACGVRDVIQEAEIGFRNFFASETVGSMSSRMNWKALDTPSPAGAGRARPTGRPTAGKATEQNAARSRSGGLRGRRS